MKTLTVVLTNYNRPKIILPVIESVYNQNVSGVEIDILVIDDCSDESIDKNDIIKYGERINIIKLEENGGLHNARNRGLEMAKGDFVLVADDDDLFIANSLSKAIRLITQLPSYEDYPVYQFPRKNGGVMTQDFLMVTEEHYYCHIIKGDFTPIINKLCFQKKHYKYPEYDVIRKISCENLLWCDIGNKFGIPTWNYSIIEQGTSAPIRLTSSSNWVKKAPQFAILQELTIEFMITHNFDKKYSQYYNSKVLGLYIYTLLSKRKKEARNALKKYCRNNLFIKNGLLLLSIIPASFINMGLGLYRTLK
jgi:glycosyltransferase involved in cell wall biosynthesis